MSKMIPSPLLGRDDFLQPSVFTPENLLREARRQKNLPLSKVSDVCVLDPDGDLVRQLSTAGKASKDKGWACYHTDLYRTRVENIELGIVGCAVGASFAVLVAEQLFASGCRLLISMTSAGQAFSQSRRSLWRCVISLCSAHALRRVCLLLIGTLGMVDGWEYYIDTHALCAFA